MATQQIATGTGGTAVTWTVTSADEITVTPQSGTTPMKIDIRYDEAALLSPGLSTIKFDPNPNEIADPEGFRFKLDLSITNALPVSTDGFGIMMSNDHTPLTPDPQSPH